MLHTSLTNQEATSEQGRIERACCKVKGKADLTTGLTFNVLSNPQTDLLEEIEHLQTQDR